MISQISGSNGKLVHTGFYASLRKGFLNRYLFNGNPSETPNAPEYPAPIEIPDPTEIPDPVPHQDPVEIPVPDTQAPPGGDPVPEIAPPQE